MKTLNPSKYIKDNLDHTFFWLVSVGNCSKELVLRILGVYNIVLEKPTLNDQPEPDRLNLFRNGVTWLFYSVNILTPWVLKFRVHKSYIF